MPFWKFWKNKTKSEPQFRKIKTLRGQKSIDKAISNGTKIIFRQVEPFSAIKGKYCIMKNKKSGKEYRIYDFRNMPGNSDEFEKVKDWTYLYNHYNFPEKAAYVIPKDLQEGETVIIDDLIENFLGYHYNQAGSDRLKSSKAIWKNNDLQIQYNPETDCIKVVG